jgi:hypothetical protein
MPKGIVIWIISALFSITVMADEPLEATVSLTSSVRDSVRYLTAKVSTKDSSLSGVEVHFYIKRMFSLLPIDKAIATDESGVAEVAIPKTLPGDSSGSVIAFAKVEDDERAGSIETQISVNGLPPAQSIDGDKHLRALWASRDKAPIFLIIASNMIITGVWGTLFYVIVQLFKLKKLQKQS